LGPFMSGFWLNIDMSGNIVVCFDCSFENPK